MKLVAFATQTSKETMCSLDEAKRNPGSMAAEPGPGFQPLVSIQAMR